MQNLTNTQGTINKFLDIVKREGNGSALDILEALTRSTLKYDDIGAAFSDAPCEKSFNQIMGMIERYQLWDAPFYIFRGCNGIWGQKAYARIKDKMPLLMRWDFFRQMYIASGFNFPVELVMDATKWRPANYLKDLPRVFANFERITIWRASRTPPDGEIAKELSWTFDPNVAMSFYYSRTPPCYLYTAEIEKSDILAVFSPETEREVLQYESAKNIREITEDELGEVCKQCDDYQRLKDCIAGVSELIKLPDSIAQMNSLLKNLKDTANSQKSDLAARIKPPYFCYAAITPESIYRVCFGYRTDFFHGQELYLSCDDNELFTDCLRKIMAMKDAAAWVRRYGTPAQVYQKDRKGFFASETFMRADRFAERLLSMEPTAFERWTDTSSIIGCRKQLK